MTIRTAVLVIDFLNHLRFEGGEKLLPHAMKAAWATRRLRTKASAVDIPVIYVNDNFGDWRADRNGIYEKCSGNCLGTPIARLLKPRKTDYFVLKARHSAFYCSTLEPLLDALKIRQLILTGLTADMCVLFTANDAYVRKYRLMIPADCTAAIDDQDYRGALRHFAKVLGADTTPAQNLELRRGATR